MKSEEPVKNYKVQDGEPNAQNDDEKPVYIQEYVH